VAKQWLPHAIEGNGKRKQGERKKEEREQRRPARKTERNDQLWEESPKIQKYALRAKPKDL